MSHFEIEDWVDFVRNVGEPEKLQQMAQHCESGCPVCSGERKMWSSVAGSYRSAVETSPPDSLVRVVTAAFGFYGPQRQSIPVRVARLLADTALTLVHGTRSAECAAGQMLFEQDGIYVDLRIDPQPESRMLMVVGQILRRNTERPFVADAPVLLISRNSPWRYLATNEVGEFQFQVEDLTGMHLVFGFEAGQTMLVPLNQNPSPVPPSPQVGRERLI